MEVMGDMADMEEVGVDTDEVSSSDKNKSEFTLTKQIVHIGGWGGYGYYG